MNYFDKKESLIESVKNLKGFIGEKLNEKTEELEYFEEELENLNFNVLCLGDFSSGKSTFINNFFLENKLKLPVRATTTTAKLTIIKYGEELKVLAVMKDGSRIEIKENVEESLKEMVASKGDKLTEVEFVEVQLPSSILKEGVVIVDSPGLNDPESERMDITFRFVNQADCVLYFLNASQAWKKSEKEFLEEKILSKDDLDKVFFLLNYWDVIDEEEERAEIIEFVNDEIKKSIDVAKEKLNNNSITIPPLIPISAKTGENFDKLKTELFAYLTGKKAQDILDAKIKKYNTYIDSYLDIISKKEKLIAKNSQELLDERKRQESELKEYKSKSDEVSKKIVKSVANSYDKFLDNLKYEYGSIVNNFVSCLNRQNIENADEFKKAYTIALKKAELLANDSIRSTVNRFRKDIENIFNKEKSELNIPVQKILDSDYMMVKISNIDNYINDSSINKYENIAVGAGVLSSLGGIGAGITLLTTSTVATTTATSGFIPWLFSTLVIGTSGTVTTVAGMSAVGVIATVALPSVMMSGLSYVALKKLSKDKFLKDLDITIEESGIQLQEAYSKKIRELQDAEDTVSTIIAENISNEFVKMYEEKLEEYKEIEKIQQDNSTFNKVKVELAKFKL